MSIEKQVIHVTIDKLGTSERAGCADVEVRMAIDGVEYVGRTAFVGKTERPYTRSVELTAAVDA